jgi:hypothetical protein
MLFAHSLYSRPVMQVQHMAERGAFGELTYASARSHTGVAGAAPAIAPVCRWLGVHQPDGDALGSMVAMSSEAGAHALIKTARGRLIELRDGASLPHAVEPREYSLHGTRGAFESCRGEQMVYLAGRTPGESWEPLARYSREFDHPRWQKEGSRAGTDSFVIDDFIAAVRTGRSPIDMVDAAAWSIIRPLGAASIAHGGKPMGIPDFRAMA